MTEFLDQLRERVASTTRQLLAAREADDPYTADIMAASLADLLRLADEHGLVVPHAADEPVA